jgi:tRNA A37 threonylcarbamoyladenosine dehydratase
MIGEAGLARLAAARAVVVGLGAVGSYATEALARAGVGSLRLVDFDDIRHSNINRQLYALESTVGKPKAEVAAQRVLDINPRCRVETLRCFAHAETMDDVLAGPPDVVIDAIDSLAPKVELLLALQQRGIPAISSMGAALRTDPTLIRVGPLTNARDCPLAARVRRRLRKRGCPADVLCVYSIEPLVHLPAAALGEAGDDGALWRGRRRRTLGSLPTLTGVFGLTAANTALRLLLGEHMPQPPKAATSASPAAPPAAKAGGR